MKPRDLFTTIRTGDEEPAPEATRTALRDVIRHCIYGIDVNPMAVELCKVSLWMESLEPGKPLTFLDHYRIRLLEPSARETGRRF